MTRFPVCAKYMSVSFETIFKNLWGLIMQQFAKNLNGVIVDGKVRVACDGVACVVSEIITYAVSYLAQPLWCIV